MTSSINKALDSHNSSETLTAISGLYSSLIGFTRLRWGGNDDGRYVRTQTGTLAGVLGDGRTETLVVDGAAVCLWLRCFRRGAFLAGTVSLRSPDLGRAAEGTRTLRHAKC